MQPGEFLGKRPVCPLVFPWFSVPWFSPLVFPDPPHPGTNWDVDHFNIGKEGQVHLEVPKGYSSPSVPMRPPRQP